jgi:hypothetical protein
MSAMKRKTWRVSAAAYGAVSPTMAKNEGDKLYC